MTTTMTTHRVFTAGVPVSVLQQWLSVRWAWHCPPTRDLEGSSDDLKQAEL